jgi:hypothetical protein
MTHLGGQTHWRRRVLIFTVLSLFLGLVTTWAVAWGLMLWWVPQMKTAQTLARGISVPDELMMSAGGIRSPGATVMQSTVFVHEGAAIPVLRDAAFDPQPPRWSIARRAWDMGQPLPIEVVAQLAEHGRDRYAVYTNDNQPWIEFGWREVACGWPMRCLHGWKAAGPSSCGTIDQPEWLERISAWNGDLPVTPWWPGLVVNSVIYTSMWMTILVAPATTRHVLRRARGRCVRCGYNLRGDLDAGCPECGWGRERKAKTADAGDSA